MLKRSVLFICISFFSFSLFASDPANKVIEDLIFQSELLDEAKGIRIPWNGGNTSSAILTKIYPSLSDDLTLNIVHPKNYSLFLNGVLIYRNKKADSLQVGLKDLKAKTTFLKLDLQHKAENLNAGNLKVLITKTSEIKENQIFRTEKREGNNSTLKIIFLCLFFILALIRVLSKREFDFYFSGTFLKSPRLTLEKFLGDSINPFLLFLSILFLVMVLNSFVYNFDHFEYDYSKYFGFDPDNEIFKMGLFVILIIVFLFLKRTLYLLYSWMRQETRNFSALWRTYLLSFSNLSFWYFLLCSIPLLLLSNLEFGNYFQFLFFIFAALNAIGGIMTHLNFNLKADLLTISGILAIDVFPIILLVHLLTF